jgi:hypothetical protein
MTKRYSMLVVLVCVTLFLTGVSASIATGTVKGTVQGPGGQPMAGVRVVIQSSSDSSYGRSDRTGAEGTFLFSDTPLGDFEVKAYDASNRVVATTKGLVEEADEVVTLLLQMN